MQMNSPLMLIEKAIGVHANYDLITLLLAALVLWIFSVLAASSYPHSRRPPPGPRRLPVLGNIHLLPAEYQQHTFAEWGRKYGMYQLLFYSLVRKHRLVSSQGSWYMRSFSRRQCWFSTARVWRVSFWRSAARSILRDHISRIKQTCKSAHRLFPTLSDNGMVWTDVSVQWDSSVGMPYSDRWRKHRRWLQNALLTRSRLVTYEPILQGEVRGLLRDTIRSPEDILTHVRR